LVEGDHMRVAVGSFVQESNSFTPVPGSWFHFSPQHVLRGPELFEQRSGTRTELGGIIDAAVGYSMELVPLMAASASASAGPLLADVFVALRDELLDRLGGAGPIDGVILALHGAMVAEGYADATGEVLRAFRAALGPNIPLVATLDLHANVTQQMADHATALVGYHTAPHVDLYETGQRGAALLHKILVGQAHPATALRRLPMILPAENGRTTDGPYAEVMEQRHLLAQHARVLDSSVFSVQPWLDLHDVGCSVVVITEDDPRLAAQQADLIADAFWRRRQAFDVVLTPTADAIAQALTSERQPIILGDSADAPSSGAPGDSTIILRHLLEIQPSRDCYLNIVDARAVATLIEAGVGSEVTLHIGAGSGTTFYQPLEITGTVELIADGDFVNKGLGFQGVVFHRGRTVVLRNGHVSLVVMERPVIQWDPELYRSVGLEPTRAQLVVVKSPAAFRATYGPFAADILMLDAPGVCSPNLRALPFQHVRRPLYPLDDLQDWRHA
jgi:microcystin degradation protein MlrC